MINIAEYGLIEQDVTRSLFEALGEKGQEVYCSEMSKTKKRATHCFTYLIGSQLKNVYWTLEDHELERVSGFINKKLGTVIQVSETPNSPERQAGLEAYRQRCLETQKMWEKKEQGVKNNEG